MPRSQMVIPTGQVPGYPQLEEICGHCQHWTYKRRQPDSLGWAYCRRLKKWFPNQFNPEKRSDYTPSGSRNCERWLRITKFNLSDEEYDREFNKRM